MTDVGLSSLPVDPAVVLDTLDRAVVITDPEGTVVFWNEGATRLYGWTATEVVGRRAADVLLTDGQRAVGRDIRRHNVAGHEWRGDFTLLRRDGEPVRVAVVNRPVVAPGGAVVGIVSAHEDVTQQRLLEQQAADLTEHLRLALDAGGLGTFRWDLATGETVWDAQLEALFGLPPGGFDGTFDGWVALLHPDDRAAVLAAVERAVAERGEYVVEHRTIWPDGSVRWLQGAGTVLLDDAGEVTGTIGCTRDITDRVLAEQERQRFTIDALEAAERERAHRERLELLGRINDVLAGSRRRVDVMRRVAEATVPHLGDWCSLHVLPTPDARVPDVEVAHVDPAMVAHARELQERFPFDPNAAGGIAEVIRTGRPLFLPEIDEAVLAGLDSSDEAKEEVRRLALRSAIAVPLVKRDRVLGAMQLVMTSGRRRYTEDDLALALAVAARVASSLDNIRLADQQREIAATLQASLLPPDLPTIPGVELAVRYWPAGEGVDVGGDFYDVFALDDGAWAIVTGDVCGTGPVAAAVTGLARHTIATAAWLGHRPADVLDHLNGVMRRRDVAGFLTAAFGVLRARPRSASLELAVGGHPLPVLVRADGRASFLGRPGTALGLFDEVHIRPVTTELQPGDTLVLYTDGITDVAPPHGIGDDQLLDLVARSARRGAGPDGGADAVADAIRDEISSVLPVDQRTDDIALLVVRLLGD